MTGQQLRESLHAGRPVYGTCLTNPSPWTAAAYTQLDYVFFDNEHGPFDRQTTMTLCQVFKARGIVPVVRIPVADPVLACMALDGGAEAIVCPYMEDADLLREMVGAVKYRPLKGRKLTDFLRDGTGVEPETLAYLREHNKDNVLIINIESVPAIDCLDDLLAVDGLDAVLVGPHDLSISMNMPEQYEDPAFVAAVEDIIVRARDANIGAGIIYWESIERQIHYIKKGANLIHRSADITEASKGLNTALADLRAMFGK